MPFVTTELSDPRFEVDGLRQATVMSSALGRRGDCTFWAPPGVTGPLPLVILLHGVYGSHWAWAQKGGAHRSAAALIADGKLPPLALAMPSDGLFGLGSGYVKHAAGDFRAWILSEIPELAAAALDAVSPESPLSLAGLTEFEQMKFFVGDISGYDVVDDDRSVLASRTPTPSIPGVTNGRTGKGTSAPPCSSSRRTCDVSDGSLVRNITTSLGRGSTDRRSAETCAVRAPGSPTKFGGRYSHTHRAVRRRGRRP
jgi:hypothetical protein